MVYSTGKKKAEFGTTHTMVSYTLEPRIAQPQKMFKHTQTEIGLKVKKSSTYLLKTHSSCYSYLITVTEIYTFIQLIHAT